MKLRQIVFWGHFSLGITAGLLILVMALSGMGLAFKSQILEQANHAILTVKPPVQGVKLGIPDIINLIELQHPNLTIRSLTVFSDPQKSLKLNYGNKKDLLYVNPYTGADLGKQSSWAGVFNQIEAIHRWFGVEGALKPVMQQVKAVSTLILILMVVSGFYLSWPYKWAAFKAFKTPLQCHKAIGFWMSPFILVVAFTGMVMSASEGPPKKPESSKGELKAYALGTLYNTLDQTYPTWVSMTFRVGTPDKAAVMVEIPGSFKSEKLQLTLDATTGEIKQTKKQNTWIKGLHTGEVAGLLGEILTFLASLATVMLTGTGFWMAYIRLRRKNA